MPERFPPAVTVVGAGLMGHGIAHVFAVAGFHVNIWDPDPQILTEVPNRIADHLHFAGADYAIDITLADSLEQAVAGADVVFEAAPEQLALKQDLMRQLGVLAPEAIVATNTSVLRISEIAEGSPTPDRIVGAHWWNPPYLIPVVEIVRGQHTSQQTADTVTDLLISAGKTPVPVNRDAPGFVGNRMQFALWREAMAIVEEGICSAEDVDLIARQTFGRRLAAIGPLENADFIGLDLTAAIMDYLLPNLSRAAAAPGLVRRPLNRGSLGAKTGSGLLDWPAGAREATERRLLEHLLALGAGPIEDGPT